MRYRTRVVNVGALVSTLLIASLVVAIPAAAATWSSAGSMAVARVGHHAVPLVDGRVLVTAGFSPSSGNGGYDTRVSEIYDPSTNTWSATGSTANGRNQSAAVRLADGRVLVSGGINANICANDVTTELYEPSIGTWSFSGNVSLARAFPTATLLSDGRVLLAGGGNRCGAVFASAEVYDPGTGIWSSTGNMTTGREFHNAVLLEDGRVLVAGGNGPFPFATQSSSEIYDPASGTWTPTGSMSIQRCCGGPPFLTLLTDGRVLAAGGYSGFGSNVNPNGPQAEIYDPATGVWTPTGSMSVGRGGATFSLLNNGMVLAAGGTDGTTWHSSAELWDPTSEMWSSTAALAAARAGQASATLSTGRVLVVGGADSSGCPPCLSSAELYEATLEVSIDIMPGSATNPINLSKKGSIAVAVLGTPTVEASTVDPSSICFGDAENVGQRDCTVAPGTVLEDVNSDGVLDIVLHFETQQTGIDPGDTQACLTGELLDGTSIEGCDSIKTR